MNDKTDRAIEETRAFLGDRRPPDVRAAVMGRIQNLEPFPMPGRTGLIRRLVQNLWAPREIVIRPAFALAAAAATVALLVIPYARSASPVAPQAAAGPADQHLFVQFHLD